MSLALILALATACRPAEPVEVADGTLFGLPVKTLDNGLVRVSVTPQIGARVLDFSLKAGNRRTLRLSRENIGKKPGEQWTGAEYGGLSDVATLDWPGPFWGVEYKAEWRQVAGNTTLRVTAESDGIGIQRDLILIPDSTILRAEITQTNLGKAPKDMVIRLHGEFAIGDRADDHDVIMFRSPKGLVEIPYRLGWENPRFSHENPSEGWMACVDAREKLALIRRFFPPGKDLRVLLWHGHNEGGAVRDERGGFYAIDRFAKPQRVEPGKSILAAEEFYIVAGLPRVDFVAEHVAGALMLDRMAYGTDDKATATVVVGGGTKGGPYVAELAIRFQDGTERAVGKVTVPPHAPGKVASASVEWPVTASCTLVARVADSAGKLVASVSRGVVWDSEGPARARLAIGQAKDLVSRLTQALYAKKLHDSPQGLAQIALARLYENVLHCAAQEGDFGRIRADGAEVLRRLEALVAHAAALEPADPARQRAIAELLREPR